MEETMSKKNTRIVFPEHITSVILEIMKKYGLEETEQEFLKKFKSGKIRRGAKMAEIIKKTAEEKISIKKLPSILKENFNLSIENAQNLAKDLEEKVLKLAQKISEIPETETIIESKPKENSTPKLESKLKVEASEETIKPPRDSKNVSHKDTYREIVE